MSQNDYPVAVIGAGPVGERDVLASAVIDASGTYTTPNWAGAIRARHGQVAHALQDETLIQP